MTSIRKGVYCVVAMALAWYPALTSSSYGLVTRVQQAFGWPDLVRWLALVSVDHLLPVLLFAVACWLVWQAEHAYGSPYRWLPLVLGGIRVAVGLLFVATLRLQAPEWTSDVEFGARILFAALLTAASLIAVFEPYTSRPLERRDRLIALAGGAALAAVLLFTPIGVVGERMYWYMGYAAGLVLNGFGLPTDNVVLVTMIPWTAWLSYLAVRTAVAWRRFGKHSTVSELEEAAIQ